MKSRILQFLILITACAACSALTWQYAEVHFYKHFENLAIEQKCNQLYPVVYCKKTIPANTAIAPEHLEFRKVPLNILPANAIENYAYILGRKSGHKIEKGSPIEIADFDDLKAEMIRLKYKGSSEEQAVNAWLDHKAASVP